MSLDSLNQNSRTTLAEDFQAEAAKIPYLVSVRGESGLLVVILRPPNCVGQEN
jgi:hypothetical protein